MEHANDIRNRIIQALKPVDPYRVILFGSYARGNPGKNSDIDLYVVTKDEFIPKNFREKKEIYLNVARNLYEIEKEIPIDLIVHTKDMSLKFTELGGAFSCRIISEGVILL
jgi:predicted nucleotidyltransferase